MMDTVIETPTIARACDAAQFLEPYNPMTYEELLVIAQRRDARDIPRLVEAVLRLKDCYREAGLALGWPHHPADMSEAGFRAMVALHG
jgi:hypothetical protein